MFLVYYVDDFHKTHITIAQNVNELNFIKRRFEGNILSIEATC